MPQATLTIGNSETSPLAPMTASIINRFILLLDDSLSALGAKVPMTSVEQLAMNIQASMEHGLRVYHGSSHVLDLCEGMNPRQTLAALYHDLAYVQLDDGFPEHAASLLRSVVFDASGTLTLRQADPADTGLALCLGVFGLKGGDALPVYGAMNEFLSAVIAVRTLSGYLAPADLLAIVACIEATIPFRSCDVQGREPAERLAERLRQTGAALQIPLDAFAIDTMVLDAVMLANRDVGGFAVDDQALFLSRTWMLIEESNAPLTRVGTFSAQDYRKALMRMEDFLATLNPASIFQRFHGQPSDSEMQRLCRLAKANLDFAVLYLGAKVAATAIIEALALETGGNAPMSMFLGDLRGIDGTRPVRVEDFLPRPDSFDDLDTRLLEVLEKGRGKESSNDLNASPLTAFLYRSLGDDGMRALIGQARQMFAGTLTPVAFLLSLPKLPVIAIIDGCRHIAISRVDRLEALRARIEQS